MDKQNFVQLFKRTQHLVFSCEVCIPSLTIYVIQCVVVINAIDKGRGPEATD